MPTPRSKVITGCDTHLVPFPTITNEAVIGGYIAHQSAHQRWRPATIRVRRLQLERIANELPAPLIDATEDNVHDWYERLRGKPETRASYASALHGVYRWMTVTARPPLRTDDPSRAIERPRVPLPPPRPMGDRHYDLALACAVSNPEMYLWLALMGCCGLRCCEIAWLNVADVEQLEQGGLLHITGKGGKQRVVPVGEMLLLTMRPFLHGRGPVFTRPSDGRAHEPHNVSQRVSRFLTEVGVPAPARAHSLRHRFGTDIHGLDPDLFRQAKIMGHASVETTQRYTEVSPTEAARHIEQLTQWRLQPGRRDRHRRWGMAG